jgi:hypothetical protein
VTAAPSIATPRAPYAGGLLGIAGNAAFFGYAIFLIVSGGVLGILVPRWGPLDFEVYARAVFAGGLHGEPLVSTLNQYRFMKSMEFGFGLFALLFRREIYTQRKMNRYFLGILFLGAFDRLLSMVLDGRPHPAYVFFVGLETVVGVIIYLHTRPSVAASRA